MPFSLPPLQDANGEVENGALLNATFPSTPTEGALLLAGIASAGVTHTFTPPVGWTEREIQIGGNQTCAIFFKVAGAAEPTFQQWTLSVTEDARLYMAEFPGNTASPDDVSAGQTVGGGGVTSKSTGTTAVLSQNDELGFAIMSVSPAVTAFLNTWTNGYAQLYEQIQVGALDIGLTVAAFVISDGAAQETTESWLGAARCGSAIATFRAAPPAPESDPFPEYGQIRTNIGQPPIYGATILRS